MRIAAELVVRILAGEIEKYDELPSGPMLGREFDTSDSTGKRAKLFVVEETGLAETDETGRCIAVADVTGTERPTPKQAVAWSRSSGETEKIMGDLADMILTYRLPAGDALPSDETLAEHWFCSKRAARLAKRRLCLWPGFVEMRRDVFYAAGSARELAS
jgi:DNA-binding GntR family transcriptional regulator